MESPEKVTPKTKKEISKYIHRLINRGETSKAEQFLLQCLDSGDRSTIILGSLINLYKADGRWKEVESLCREYLVLKPNNSFAQNALDNALKVQEKIEKTSHTEKSNRKQQIHQFRKQIYEGNISIEDISDELFATFTPLEKTILLAELYSYFNLPHYAIKQLKQAANMEQITPKEKKVIMQALQLANSGKMKPFQKRIQWGQLSGDKEKEQWEI